MLSVPETKKPAYSLGDTRVFGVSWYCLKLNSGGEGGIRTPDTCYSTPDFESGTFNHSATSPALVVRYKTKPPIIAKKSLLS